jgi:hypothetical protein
VDEPKINHDGIRFVHVDHFPCRDHAVFER